MALIFFTVFLYLLGFGIIIPILPLLSKSFGATAVQTGLLMSIYSFMQFFFAPFWGRLSDKKGRRPILIYCLLGEGLAYILFAYARSWEMLMVARGLAGFFAASISTASAYISDITAKEDRTKGMAIIGMAFGLGFVVGPALGGLLASVGKNISQSPHFDTTFTLLFVAALCLSTFIFAYLFLKESLKKNTAPTAHLQEKRHRLATLLHYSKKSHIGPLVIVFGLLSIAMSAMESTLVLHVDEKFNWGIQQVSYGFAYIGMIMIFTQGLLVRKLIPALGENRVLLVGISLFVLGLFGIGFSPSIPFLALSMTLFAIGNGLTNPSILGSISLLSPAEDQGVTLGVTQSFASLGRILGPLLGGFVFQSFFSSAPFLMAGLLGLIGLFLILTNYKYIPNSGKKTTDKKTFDFLALQMFQFQNLIQNRIPFLLLHHSGHLDLKNLSSLELAHLDKVTQKITPQWSPEDLQKNSIDRTHPIVVVCEAPAVGQTLCQKLHTFGYTNSYYLIIQNNIGVFE